MDYELPKAKNSVEGLTKLSNNKQENFSIPIRNM